MCARRKLLDLKVSITGGVHLDLVKRVLRDLDRSGQAADEIITQVGGIVGFKDCYSKLLQNLLKQC